MPKLLSHLFNLHKHGQIRIRDLLWIRIRSDPVKVEIYTIYITFTPSMNFKDNLICSDFFSISVGSTIYLLELLQERGLRGDKIM